MRKVKELYVYDKEYDGLEVSTEKLISMGTPKRTGQVEELEAKIDHLTGVIARLIDHLRLSDEDAIKIAGAGNKVKPIS